jgi:hypothetical protein
MDNLPFVKGNCDFGFNFRELQVFLLFVPGSPKTINYTCFIRIVKGIFMDFPKFAQRISCFPHLPRTLNYTWIIRIVKGIFMDFPKFATAFFSLYVSTQEGELYGYC